MDSVTVAISGLSLLVLILIANATPLLVGHWLPAHWLRAIDGGHQWRDGRALLGPSKTWAGLISAVAATALAAQLMGLPASLGAAMAIAAMVGDLLSSFCKRRQGLASGISVPGLDQLPESLLPALIGALLLNHHLTTALLAVLVFILLHILLTELLDLTHLHQKKIGHR